MEKYKGYSFIFIVLIIALINFFLKSDNYINDNIEAFKNGEVLVCHKTLIVSNENWKLNQSNLINNNSVGYVQIENCEIQKEKGLK